MAGHHYLAELVCWMGTHRLLARRADQSTQGSEDSKALLDRGQFASLVQLCPLNTFVGARRQSMLWLMVTTGVRRNEMWMLKKQDLGWDHSVLRRTLPLSTLMKGFSPDTLRRMRPPMPPKRVMLKYIDVRFTMA